MADDYHWITRFADSAVNTVFGCIPRKPLNEAEWRNLQLVAHRGCANPSHFIYENTLSAFEAARDAGVWGIEFDVQWTLDDWPVVIHDPHTGGLPGPGAVEVAKTELDELRQLSPLVPRLEEVLEQFAAHMHLMIELKGRVPNSKAGQRLQDCLTKLQPVEEYHLMSLEPAPLRELDDYPVASKLLIATTNTRSMFEQFRQGGFGGFTGHFLLLNKKMRAYLQSIDAPWGTGFVDSLNLLAREIRSDTTWVFSNAADKIMLSR